MTVIALLVQSAAKHLTGGFAFLCGSIESATYGLSRNPFASPKRVSKAIRPLWRSGASFQGSATPSERSDDVSAAGGTSEGASSRFDPVARSTAFQRSGTASRSGTRLNHVRSEEHTPELPSQMRISYSVFCL